MSGLLLDTHAWIWLAAGDKRMAKFERRINVAAANRSLFLCAISIYEAATIGFETDKQTRRGKQAVSMRPTVRDWVRGAVNGTGVEILAMGEDDALDAASFHSLHRDPFDRLIVAAAIRHDLTLLTADALISQFADRSGLRVVAL